MAIRLHIVHRRLLVRQTLAAALAPQPDIDVVAEASDGRAALACVSAFRPRVAVVDPAVPDGGESLVSALVRTDPDLAVLVLASSPWDPQATERLVSAGARGILLPDRGFTELIAAIQSLDRDGVAFPPSQMSAGLAPDVPPSTVRPASPIESGLEPPA